MLNVGNEVTYKQLEAELRKVEPPKPAIEFTTEPKSTASPEAYTNAFITRLSIQKGINHA